MNRTENLSWDNTREIAAELAQACPSINMLTIRDSDLLDKIETLPIYKNLPALPDDWRKQSRILYKIKQAYVDAVAETGKLSSSVDQEAL